MSLARKGFKRSLLAAALCVSCSPPGCDTSGFEQLSSKTPSAIELPGEELGEVNAFTPMHALGREGQMEAVAGLEEDGDVRIVRRDGTGCTALTLPEGTAPGRALPTAAEDLLVTLESTEEDPATLRLFDMDCSEVMPEFESASAVAGSERLVPFRLLIHAGTDLFAVDATNRTRKRVLSGVTLVSIAAQHVIALSDGKLVVMDLALERVAEHGADVTELTLLEGSGRLVYVEGGALFRLDAPMAVPVRVDRDACSVVSADGPSRTRRGARFVSAFSPCNDQTVAVFDLERGTRFDVGPASSSRAVVQPSPTAEGDSVVFYRGPLDEEGIATSSALYDGQNTALGDGEFTVGLRAEEGVLVWLANGSGKGPLVRWNEAGVETVYESIQGFEPNSYPERALVVEDHEVSVVALEGFPEPRVLGRGVTNTGRGGPSALVIVDELEDNVGKLSVFDTETGDIELVAEGVHQPSANYWFSGESLFYVEQYDLDRELGRLCMRVTANLDTFCEPDVRDFRVLNRPERGVALVKRVGDEDRLFWADVE